MEKYLSHNTITKKRIVLGAIATSVLTAASLFSASSASALNPFQGAAVDCTAGTFTGTVECEGVYSGNDSNQIDENTELFDLTGWKELTKINTSENISSYSNDLIQFSGTGSELKNNISWAFKSGFDLSIASEIFFSVKGGPGFSTYLWDGTSTGGTFNTAGIVKGNGKAGPGLSHLSVYYRAVDPVVPPGPTPVPTPAAILPVLGGLFGAASRRKKSSEETETVS
ncbi:MAG: PTPA-CTERM sorting domain-containing protein [Limnothrix sp.]